MFLCRFRDASWPVCRRHCQMMRMPFRRISSSALTCPSRSTYPRAFPMRVTSFPAASMSSAVAFTQYSVAMPQTWTLFMSRRSRTSATDCPASFTPSQPEYCSMSLSQPLKKTSPSETNGRRDGWISLPGVPVTQCAGHRPPFSLNEQWSAGWWSQMKRTGTVPVISSSPPVSAVVIRPMKAAASFTAFSALRQAMDPSMKSPSMSTTTRN